MLLVGGDGDGVLVLFLRTVCGGGGEMLLVKTRSLGRTGVSCAMPCRERRVFRTLRTTSK